MGFGPTFHFLPHPAHLSIVNEYMNEAIADPTAPKGALIEQNTKDLQPAMKSNSVGRNKMIAFSEKIYQKKKRLFLSQEDQQETNGMVTFYHTSMAQAWLICVAKWKSART